MAKGKEILAGALSSAVFSVELVSKEFSPELESKVMNFSTTRLLFIASYSRVMPEIVSLEKAP